MFSVLASPAVPQYSLPLALKAASMDAGARFSIVEARAVDAASSETKRDEAGMVKKMGVGGSSFSRFGV